MPPFKDKSLIKRVFFATCFDQLFLNLPNEHIRCLLLQVHYFPFNVNLVILLLSGSADRARLHRASLLVPASEKETAVFSFRDLISCS